MGKFTVDTEVNLRLLLRLVTHRCHTDHVTETCEVDRIHLRAAEEVQNEVLHQHVLLGVLPQVALEQEHGFLTRLTLPMSKREDDHLQRLEGLHGLVIQHTELHHVEELVVEETTHNEVLGTLLGVASDHKQTAVVLLGEELERIQFLEGTNVVLL